MIAVDEPAAAEEYDQSNHQTDVAESAVDSAKCRGVEAQGGVRAHAPCIARLVRVANSEALPMETMSTAPSAPNHGVRRLAAAFPTYRIDPLKTSASCAGKPCDAGCGPRIETGICP